MVNTEPNPIKEYYVAYFDILGFKDFFQQQPEKVPELLNSIHDAIRRTKGQISIANQSPIMSRIGNIEIHAKIFSDNILLCMESLSGELEQLRLLLFFEIVATTQRGFVNEYGLFVRGGIVKGELSFNDDYVFGQGLIDAVKMEERAQSPRIIIAKDLIAFLQEDHFYIVQEISRALEIGERLKAHETVSAEEQTFYYRIVYKVQTGDLIKREREFLTLLWPDGQWILCYLHGMNTSNLFEDDTKNRIIETLKVISEYDYKLFTNNSRDIDNDLYLHRGKVEEQLKKYGINFDIAVADTTTAENREKILRKYIWVMAFHNRICDLYNKPKHRIATQCNCDPRFLKMVIEVL